MLNRRAFLCVAMSAILGRPLGAAALQRATLPTIGVLYPTPPSRTPITEAFESELQKYGWIKDRTVRIEERFSGGRQEPLAALAAELVAAGVNVLVAWSPSAAVAAKRATTKIPVVFLAAGDPVGFGLVSNLARPEGNVTGISFDAALETYAKGLEILKECDPALARVALLTIIDQTAGGIQAIHDAARSLKLTLIEAELRAPGDIEPSVRKVAEQGAQGLYIAPSGLSYSFAKQFADSALANRLPSIHPFREGAFAGGLVSYSPSLIDIAHRGAEYINRILRGAKAAELPVEQPRKLELIINLKTARALGLTIPPSLLLRADQVIE